MNIDDKKLYEKVVSLLKYIEVEYLPGQIDDCTIIRELYDKLDKALNWMIAGKPTQEEIKRRELFEKFQKTLAELEAKARERKLIEETTRRRMEEIEKNATGSKND